MRNTLEYPVTKEEILECLKLIQRNIMKWNSKENSVGDMRALLLAEAIKIIEAAKYDQ